MGIGTWELVIIALIAILIFGTKRLRNIGYDLGSALKGFRRGLKGEGEEIKEEGKEAKKDLPQ